MKKRTVFIAIIISFFAMLGIGLSACVKPADLNDFKIDFVVDNVIVHTINAKADEAITAPIEPTKDGVIFDGWFLDKDIWQQPVTELSAMPSESLTLYAKWAQLYTVTFNCNDGRPIAPISGKEGATITAPTAPSKDGFTFGGWYTDNGTFLNAYTFNTMPADSITLFAKWTAVAPLKFTVTFNGNGGTLASGIAEQSVDNGGAATAPVFEKTGYNLSWDKGFNNITENTTVTAVWTIKTFTVTFNGNGGTLASGIAVQTVNYGGSAIAPVFEKTEYTLTWNKGFSNIKADTTVTAVWTVITYKLTFNSNGGSAVSQITKASGEKITAPIAPRRAGYRFDGWYTDDGIFNDDYEFGTMPPESFTVYAKWEQKPPTAGLKYEKINGDTAYQVTGGDENALEVIIPEVYEGLPVTKIANGAFLYRANVIEIFIPDSVIEIGGSAFYYCVGLTEITIPQSVTLIGDDAFNCCFKLVQVTNLSGKALHGLPSNIGQEVRTYSDTPFVNKLVTHDDGIMTYTVGKIVYAMGYAGMPETLDLSGKGINKIYQYAFNCNSELTKITIPESVTAIGKSAFYGCTSLTEITIPEGVTVIEEDTFCVCESLTKIVIPESVTVIGRYAFGYCVALTEIIFPDSLTEIGDWAFENCKALEEIIIPAGMTHISKAFSGCDSLASVTIGENVKFIGEYAFYDCTALSKISIPSSVTYIGEYAFYDCTALSEISIPSSVTYIGQEAFWNCAALLEIVIPDSVTYLGHDAFFGCSALTSATIGNGVTDISGGTFYGCSALETLILGESVEKIGECAFNDCSSLLTIDFSDSLASLDFDAFLGTAWYANQPDGLIYAGKAVYKYKGYMPKDTPITLLPGTKGIAAEAFYNCSNLVSINFPAGLTHIGTSAFYGCSGLTSVDLPVSLTSIGDGAFGGCSGLTSVTIPGNVERIQYVAFQNCSGLTSAIISEGVTSIETDAFYGCSDLSSITFPDSLTSVARYAFHETAWYENQENGVIYTGKVAYGYKGDMPENTTITFVEGTKGVAEEAFYGYSKLTSINFPASLTNIGVEAFHETGWYISRPDGVIYINQIAYCYIGDMPDGSKITLIAGTKAIAAKAFFSRFALTEITIPDSVTDIGDKAFFRCIELTEVAIGSGVTSIGEEAFYNCCDLERVYINAATPPSLSKGAFEEVSGDLKIYVPQASLEAYKTANGWIEYAHRIYAQE